MGESLSRIGLGAGAGKYKPEKYMYVCFRFIFVGGGTSQEGGAVVGGWGVGRWVGWG